MSKSRPAWRISIAVCVTTLACNSEVTVEPAGTGGDTTSTSSSGAGGTTSVGGSGGAVGGGGAGAAGGTGGVGGQPAGGSGGDGGGGGQVCAGFNECTDCISAGCSEVYCACANEIHCLEYLGCLAACESEDLGPECPQMCAEFHEPGIAAAILVVDCAATVCDGTCQFGKELNDCQTCLYTSCPEQMNACIADAECLALVKCLQMCSGDMACAQACIGDHPEGLPKAQAVKMCQTDNCFDPCL